MGIIRYLAMTAEELAQCPAPPFPLAWLDGHFSLYGTGLSGLPQSLPDGAMLILTDIVPLRGHSPKDVVLALESLSPACVLLDFQNPPTEESCAMAKAITQALPCPVAVTEAYAACTQGVILVCPPLSVPLEQHIAPWAGRELWLELAAEEGVVTITEDGAIFCPRTHGISSAFFDSALCCGYRIEKCNDRVAVYLRREAAHWDALAQKAEALGFTAAVGLYQQSAGGK